LLSKEHILRRFRWTITTLIVLAMQLGVVSAYAETRLLSLNAGIHRIEAEVASTFSERAEGLMHRKSMAMHRGMLFVFNVPGEQCMWMRNTLIPLSVAFLDADGIIINIEEMQPETLDNHCAQKPAKFALEMNAGWFKSHGVATGSKIKGVENAPAAH